MTVDVAHFRACDGASALCCACDRLCGGDHFDTVTLRVLSDVWQCSFSTQFGLMPEPPPFTLVVVVVVVVVVDQLEPERDDSIIMTRMFLRGHNGLCAVRRTHRLRRPCHQLLEQVVQVGHGDTGRLGVRAFNFKNLNFQ